METNTHTPDAGSQFELKDSITLGSRMMTPEAFGALRAHPTQRTTAVHAHVIARKGVLDTPNAQHTRAAAMLYDATGAHDAEALARMYRANPDEALRLYGFKVDGHTRSYIWAAGKAPAPAVLDISVTSVNDLAAAVRLYNAFDSVTAAKGQGDTMTSTLEAAGVFPSSDLFQSPRFLRTTLDLLWSLEHGRLGLKVPTRVSPSEAPETLGDETPVPIDFDKEVAESLPYLPLVTAYAETLRVLDDMHLTKKLLPLSASYIAGYAAIIQRDGQQGEDFVQSLLGATGSSNPGGMDAVHAIKNSVARIEIATKSKKPRAVHRVSMSLSCVLNAYEAHKAGTSIAPYPDTEVFSPKVVATFNPIRKVKTASAKGKKAIKAVRPGVEIDTASYLSA